METVAESRLLSRHAGQVVSFADVFNFVIGRNLPPTFVLIHHRHKGLDTMRKILDPILFGTALLV